MNDEAQSSIVRNTDESIKIDTLCSNKKNIPNINF